MWTEAVSIKDAAANRSIFHKGNACYVFTVGNGPIDKAPILYVGSTKDLRTRMRAYLKNNPMKASSKTKHSGAQQLLEQRATKLSDEQIYVRWTSEWKSNDGSLQILKDFKGLEGELIEILEPKLNAKFEYNSWMEYLE